MNKYLIIAVLFILSVLAAWWLGFSKNITIPNQHVQASVMLEKVKLVTKLVSVEGQFSEILEKKEWYNYDFFNLFSKKILVRVQAKVSVGYNFESLNISVDSV